jgi:hypothetical protein
VAAANGVALEDLHMTKTLGIIAAAIVALSLLIPTAGEARPEAADCEVTRKAVRAEIDAACPCDGPNAHTDYLRCVSKKLRDLSACATGADGMPSCGPVSRLCAAKIRRTAARSACRKPAGMVTCCVPTQRECAGDSTPGDRTKDGTCTGTTRKCDSVTECLVPKCELAATAERCGLIGGTVGLGRDCATACAP